MGEGKKFCPGNCPVLKDVLSGLEVKPKVGIIEWPGCKEKSNRENINVKDLA
jgi:hypothetical protein